MLTPAENALALVYAVYVDGHKVLRCRKCDFSLVMPDGYTVDGVLRAGRNHVYATHAFQTDASVMEVHVGPLPPTSPSKTLWLDTSV